MPSVYFLRNCNNYEEHNDFLIEEICSYGALCFNSHHHELCIFTSNEQEFVCFHCKKSAPAEVTRCFWQCCCNAPPTTSLCSHPLFDLHKLSTGISKCQWVSFFSTWRSSIPCLWFICASMSDAILSECPSAAICCMATTCNGILVGRYNLYCYNTSIYL